ncbi:MAG TPA: TetR/AcrR family transcriptional regulator [Solirubrobacteraceae bacterium]|jgi:AcrR family transcriptional regulator
MERISPRQTQQQRRERTRTALVAAAAEVFARKGYAAARVEEIADRANLTTGALYGHFQSKHELFLAVFDEFAAQRVRDVEHATTAGSNRVLSLRAGADQWMNQLDQAPWRFWLHLEFAHHASQDPHLRERFALSVGAVRLAISRLIEQYAADREIDPPVSADWLATVIRALGMGLSLERLTDPQAVPPEMFGQAIELITDLLQGAPEASTAFQPSASESSE